MNNNSKPTQKFPPICRPVSTVLAMLGLIFVHQNIFALPKGANFSVSMKPASGGMSGAAFAMPQEVSAAVFGNPATLTQFPGTQFGLGASILKIKLENTQTGAGGTNLSDSAADNYVIPDAAFSRQIGESWVIGAGIQVGAGLGADFRDDPVRVGAVPGTELPFNSELLSFNANLSTAKQITPSLSIGAAATVGFGLLQIGTVGQSGPDIPTGQFGGTTSSVHDTGVRFSLGITQQVSDNIILSALYKSKLKYEFTDVTFTSVAPKGLQTLTVEQPAEYVLGAAMNLSPSWLIEIDIMRNLWSGASTYEDIYKDQTAFVLGTQYKLGDWSFRLGYSHQSDQFRDEPNKSINSLHGIGTIPLPFIDNDLIKIVQTASTPGVSSDSVSLGIGYDIAPSTRIDAFGAYSFKESLTRNTPNVDAALGLPVSSSYRTDVTLWVIGVGVNFKY
jgi:long-chain fatty acid transport protein